MVCLAACLTVIAAAAFARLLARVRPGSLLSACMLLFLRQAFSLRDAAVYLTAEAESKAPSGLEKLSNHAIQSLDIAADFNSLIPVAFHTLRESPSHS